MTSGHNETSASASWAGMPRVTKPRTERSPERVQRIQKLQRLLGDRDLRQHRLAAGWSQIALATHLGVRRTVVSQWEGGGYTPSPDHLVALLDWMNSAPTVAVAG